MLYRVHIAISKDNVFKFMSIIFRLFFITVSKGQTIAFDITPIDTDKVSERIYINITNYVNSLNGVYRITVQKIVAILQNRRNMFA